MAFRKKNNIELVYPEVQYKQERPGRVIMEGTLIDIGIDKFKKPSYRFKIEDDPEKVYVINSSSHLDWLMKQYVSLGDYVKITYEGKKEIKKGTWAGTFSHNFTLEIDDDKFDQSYADKRAVKKEPQPEPSESEPAPKCDEDLEDMTL